MASVDILQEAIRLGKEIRKLQAKRNTARERVESSYNSSYEKLREDYSEAAWNLIEDGENDV